MENYFCNICNKKYASYQSLWNHTKKFHKSNELLNNKNISPNNEKNTSTKFIQKSSIEKFQCIYCKKFYKNSSSKSFHMKSCKLNYPEIQIINNKNICDICNKKFVFSTSVYKHRKLCQQKQINLNHPISNITINTNNNINTNNTNNINSNNIINNITQQILNFKENSGFYKILTIEHKNIILNSGKYTINKIVEFTIFNKNHPELNNIFIINLKDKYSYIFENIKYITSLKRECLNDIINFSIDVIDDFINDITINESSKYHLKDFNRRLNNLDLIYQNGNKIYANTREYIMEILKIFIYDNSDKKIFKNLINTKTLKRIKSEDFFKLSKTKMII